MCFGERILQILSTRKEKKGEKNKMKLHKKHLSAAIAFALTLTVAASLISILPAANAADYTDKTNTLRKTAAYLSVRPYTICVGQELLLNMWVYPPPRGPYWYMYTNVTGFTGLSLTFTRPDGSKDTFMPREGQGTPAVQADPGD